MAEVAVREQTLALLVFEAGFLALAGGDGTEFRVTDGDVGADPSTPVAQLAPAVGVFRLFFRRDIPATADRHCGGREIAEYL